MCLDRCCFAWPIWKPLETDATLCLSYFNQKRFDCKFWSEYKTLQSPQWFKILSLYLFLYLPLFLAIPSSPSSTSVLWFAPVCALPFGMCTTIFGPLVVCIETELYQIFGFTRYWSIISNFSTRLKFGKYGQACTWSHHLQQTKITKRSKTHSRTHRSVLHLKKYVWMVQIPKSIRIAISRHSKCIIMHKQYCRQNRYWCERTKYF